MKLVPVGEKIVVKRLDAEEITSGGIVLPDSAKKRPRQGRVLSVGDGQLLPDGTRAPHQVGEGDRILRGPQGSDGRRRDVHRARRSQLQ